MIKKKIREILKNGKRIKTEYFDIYIKKREDLKIGFIANAKIGSPVKRNKIKRYIRELVKANFKKGDMLFVLKREVMDREKDQIEDIFKKIKNEINNSIN
ncbi:MAG: ribonuclease P protein component [Candidatus Ratteibacteria bacterium]